MGELILRLITDARNFAQGLDQARAQFQAFNQNLTAQAEAQKRVFKDQIAQIEGQMIAAQRAIQGVMSVPIDRTALNLAKEQVRQLEGILRDARAALTDMQRQAAVGLIPPAQVQMQAEAVQDLTHDLAKLRGEYQLISDGVSQATQAQQQYIARQKADLIGLASQLKIAQQGLSGLNTATKTLAHAQHSLLDAVTTQITAHAQAMVNAGTMLKQFGSVFRTLAIPMLAFTALIVGIGTSVAKLGAEYSQTMDIVRSSLADMSPATREAEQQFSKLEAVIISLGEKLKFTTSEVATAAKFLAQAGLSSAEVMAALPGTLNLALSGMLELGRAAEIAADFMNAFGFSGQEINRVADVIAKTAVVANTSVEQLGNAFSFVTPVAANLGQSIEDVAVGLAALSNSAIKSSRAGTGLAQIYSALVKDADKTQALMERYGSSFDAVNPQVRSLVEIVSEFNRVGISAGDVMKHFGERAGRAMLALVNTPVDKLLEYSAVIKDSFGSALEQAERRWQNLSGALAEFQSKVEAIGIAVFRVIETDLIRAVKMAVETMGKFLAILRDPANANAVKVIIYLTTAMAGLTGALGLTFLGLWAFFSALGGVSGMVGSMAIAINSTNGALTKAALVEAAATIAAEELALGNTAAAASYRALATAATGAGGTIASETALMELQAAITARNATGAANQGLFGRGIGLAVQGFQALAGVLPLVIAALATLGVLIAAAVTAWQRSNEESAKATQSSMGFLQALTDIWEYLKGVWNETGRYLAMIPGMFDLDVSQWELLVTQMQMLGTELGRLWTILQPVVSLLVILITAPVVLTARVAWEALLLVLNAGMAVLRGAVWLLNTGLETIALGLRGLITLAVEGLADVAKWISTVQMLGDPFRHWLGEAADKALEKWRKFKDEAATAGSGMNSQQGQQFLVDVRPESTYYSGQVKELQEYLRLLKESNQNENQLDAAQNDRLATLKEKYGSMQDTVMSLSAFIDEVIPKLQALAVDKSQTENVRKDAETRLHVFEEMKTQIAGAVKGYQELDAAGSTAIDREASYHSERAKNLRETEKLHNDAANAREELNKSESRHLEILTKMEKSELQGREKEVFEQIQLERQLADSTEKYVNLRLEVVRTAERNLEGARQSALDAEKRHQKALTETRKKYAIERIPESQREGMVQADSAVVDSSKDVTNANKGLETSKKNAEEAAAHNEEMLKKEAAAAVALSTRQTELAQKHADAKERMMDDVKLMEARAAEDKRTQLQIENKRFLEEERKKVNATFDMHNESDRKLAEEIMKRAEQVAALKVTKLEEEIAEKEEKEREKLEKERRKKLKEAIDPVQTVENAAAKAVAEHVRNVTQLIQLYLALHQIRMHQEVMARKAMERTFVEQQRSARMQRQAALNPDNAQMQVMADQQARRAAFAAMVTGKRIATAGMTPEQIALFEEVKGGGAGGPVGGNGVGGGRNEVLDVLKITQGVTVDILELMKLMAERMGVVIVRGQVPVQQMPNAPLPAPLPALPAPAPAAQVPAPAKPQALTPPPVPASIPIQTRLPVKAAPRPTGSAPKSKTPVTKAAKATRNDPNRRQYAPVQGRSGRLGRLTRSAKVPNQITKTDTKRYPYGKSQGPYGKYGKPTFVPEPMPKWYTSRNTPANAPKAAGMPSIPDNHEAEKAAAEAALKVAEAKKAQADVEARWISEAQKLAATARAGDLDARKLKLDTDTETQEQLKLHQDTVKSLLERDAAEGAERSPAAIAAYKKLAEEKFWKERNLETDPTKPERYARGDGVLNKEYQDKVKARWWQSYSDVLGQDPNVREQELNDRRERMQDPKIAAEYGASRKSLEARRPLEGDLTGDQELERLAGEEELFWKELKARESMLENFAEAQLLSAQADEELRAAKLHLARITEAEAARAGIKGGLAGPGESSGSFGKESITRQPYEGAYTGEVSQEELDRINPTHLEKGPGSLYSDQIQQRDELEKREGEARVRESLARRQASSQERGLTLPTPKAMLAETVAAGLLKALQPLTLISERMMTGALAGPHLVLPVMPGPAEPPRGAGSGPSQESMVRTMTFQIDTKLDALTFKKMLNDVMGQELLK